MDFPKGKRSFDVVPSYKGGHTTIHGGYVFELCPHHPLANVWGFVAQHRLVGEDLIGRPLVRSKDPQSRKGEVHRTHRGKPTPKWLAACASQTVPATPPTEE
jgi:hypothetical protein